MSFIAKQTTVHWVSTLLERIVVGVGILRGGPLWQDVIIGGNQCANQLRGMFNDYEWDLNQTV